ncbi:MAG: S-layer homology domain-containing protein [Anaerovoracaceae bacterium]|jgi:hypothetical protein
MDRIRVGRQSATPSLKLCLCVFWIILSVAISSAMNVQHAVAATGNAADGGADNRSAFSDVHAWHWHAGTVARAHAAGILGGYPDGTFRPNHLVTCGEFLRMTMSCTPDSSGPLALREGAPFQDGAAAFLAKARAEETEPNTRSHWALPYYEEGLHRGLFTGADIHKAALDYPISRQVMALVYSRLMEELDGVRFARNEQGTVPKAPFTDVGDRSAYEYPIAVTAAVGLLTGYPDGSFRPESFLTRAEAAAAFVRLVDLADEAGRGGVQTPPPETPSPESPPAPASPAPGSGEPDVSIADVGESICFAYLDQFLASVRFEGSAGNYRYRFDAPALPEGYRNMISVAFYSPDGQKILAQYGHWTREASAHSVVVPMPALRSLSELGMAYMEIGIQHLVERNMHGYTMTYKLGEGNNLRIQHLMRETGVVLTEHYPGVLSNTFVWK